MKVRGQRPEVGSQRSGCAAPAFVCFVYFVVCFPAPSFLISCQGSKASSSVPNPFLSNFKANSKQILSRFLT